jgi:hypothetical protein
LTIRPGTLKKKVVAKKVKKAGRLIRKSFLAKMAGTGEGRPYPGEEKIEGHHSAESQWNSP